MNVTYIAHSGFSVETESFVLVFDYYRGALPACVTENAEAGGGKRVVFFVSHHHEDHYSRSIYSFARCANVSYVLSRDVWGAPPEAEVTYMRPGDEFADCGMEVLALRSTDCGAAFLVRADGKAIYHAGDLNLWVWDGAARSQNDAVRSAFRAEIRKLRGIKIDAAFLPLDPRQGEDGVLGFDETVRTLDIAHAFPMHFWGMPEYAKAFAASDRARGYREKITLLTREGESIEI